MTRGQIIIWRAHVQHAFRVAVFRRRDFSRLPRR